MAKSDNAVTPTKKTTAELMLAIKQAINSGDYYFTDHGEFRSKTRRMVNDLEIIRILKSNNKWHEARRDKFEIGNQDWNYHIRGINADGDSIRIVISFDENGMTILTVINLDEKEHE